jgi:CheY-like chemotaxis protein
MAQDREKLQKNIASVLVLDDDEVARNLIANHFRTMGVEDVETFGDAGEALAALESRPYSFIVSDWKLQGMSGLAFFNRIRNMTQYRTTPLMVVSGFVNKDDFRLLQEFPCTSLVEKPFTKLIFEKVVEALVAEYTWYGQNTTLVDTVLEAVKFDGKKAEQLIREIIRKAPNPIPLAVLAAKRLVKNDLLDAAKNVLQLIIQKDDKCVPALSDLGKILHMQGEHHTALDQLRMANRLSPHNLKRLCLLGEVELNLNDTDAARTYFAKALVIDSVDPMAQAGMVVAENMSEFVPATKVQDVGRSFASLMNTMGITLIRNGQYSRGIEQYRSALYFLEQAEDSAKVAFNLGLGFLRWGRPQDALPWFRKSEQLIGSSESKSANYVRMLISKMSTPLAVAPAPATANAGKVSAFSKVNRAVGGDGVAAAEDDSIDTSRFGTPSLHVAGGDNSGVMEEHVGHASGKIPGNLATEIDEELEDAMNEELDVLLNAAS